MSDLKAKIAPNSISAGAMPQTPLEQLTHTALLKPLTSKEREGKERGIEKGKGGEEERRKGRERMSLCTPCHKFLATPLT